MTHEVIWNVVIIPGVFCAVESANKCAVRMRSHGSGMVLIVGWWWMKESVCVLLRKRVGGGEGGVKQIAPLISRQSPMINTLFCDIYIPGGVLRVGSVVGSTVGS